MNKITPSAPADSLERARRGPSAVMHYLAPSADMRCLLAIPARWIERARQRRLLASLPDRMLRDMGITRYDALHEARKPFWRE